MKLSKIQYQQHLKAENILQKNELSYEEKIFVLKNWHEGANHNNSYAGAFFTPVRLAKEFSLELSDEKTVDLCAGIGGLSFYAFHNAGVQNITCVEINPKYFEVGKKILPEANWLLGSIFDPEIFDDKLSFDRVISNPPFGNVKIDNFEYVFAYKGCNFEFKAIEIGLKLAIKGTFLLPQSSTPYKFSGNNGNYEYPTDSRKFNEFAKSNNCEVDFNCGIDTSEFISEWKGVFPMCEIVNFYNV